MASSMSCSRLATCALAAVILQILGLSLFVIGFFPVKPSLSGISGPESYRMPSCDAEVIAEEVDLPPDQLKSLYRDLSKIPPTFDRLVLMVVDGLPAEFVLGRGDSHPSKAMMEAMPYTQSLLLKREAIAYHAKAAPPTVTMPRLKAMVSGAVGGFLDVAFNFNTQAFLDDNLLDQFSRIGWKMVMLGDDTWIKLFPGLFSRQDGVSSFFVKDTVEVDHNVTRHLEVELAANDWSLLILHYLGLDHVGHIGGRQSNLMAPKLNEMDGVIKMIHTQQVQDRENVDRRTLLVVVSDHGMTESGNHGGSTFEETDSLALFIGIGPGYLLYAPNEHNEVFQVDITPTLALLFGVPIPKNNIGVLLMEIFNILTDEQKLQALELNSWQLLRLLRSHIQDLCCGDFLCGINDGHDIGVVNGSFENDKEKFTQLFSRAIVAHNIWKTHQDSRFNNTDDIRVAVALYYDFLGNASEWLSHRATDKPIKLLVSGICAMLISCVLLISFLICFFKSVYFTPKQSYYLLKKRACRWYLHEAFVFLGIFAHVISLGASSMVEEEQYTWHYLTCSLYLIFLFTKIQSLTRGQTIDSTDEVKGEEKDIFLQSQRSDTREITWFMNIKLSKRKNMHHFYQISAVIIVLISGRILRGWHQGGVNWTYLPDISKWLEQSGASTIKFLQITSLLLILTMSSFALSLVQLRRSLVFMIFCSYLACGFLVLLYAMKYQGDNVVAMDHGATFIARMFYVAVVIIVILVLLVTPWKIPVYYQEKKWMTKLKSNSVSLDAFINFPLFDGIWASTYLIGVTYCVCWCLLQLLLQQPINAIPVFLLFLQLLASMIYFSTDESDHRQWIKVAAIYFLGMSGHFGLGNSNSLATVDVAGAFIGISSYSTILSGILMFIITYASSILSYLSLIMCTFVKDIGYLSSRHTSELGCILQMTIAIPCLIPLALNLIVSTASTIILLVMRNHLFIWSVFSPKYLYVCAATLSVYVGVWMVATTGVYTCTVLFYRVKMHR